MTSSTKYRAYGEPPEDSNLEQGDFIEPTVELRRVLALVHRHFCDQKYVGFLVTTQTCDLVRRPAPRANYINIAAVRSMEDVFPKLLAAVCEPVVPGAFREGARNQARGFLQRLLNQNEQALGLFYLHPHQVLGFADPSVAYLRVAVALRADHYDVLVRSRRGRLAPEFQAKLGWLIGNLYARPASPDWEDFDGGKREQLDLVNRLIDALLWVEDGALERLSEQGIDPTSLSRQELETLAQRNKPPRKIDQAAEIIGELAEVQMREAVEKCMGRLRHRLRLTLAGEQVASINKVCEDIQAELDLHRERGQVVLAVKSDSRMKVLLR